MGLLVKGRYYAASFSDSVSSWRLVENKRSAAQKELKKLQRLYGAALKRAQGSQSQTHVAAAEQLQLQVTAKAQEVADLCDPKSNAYIEAARAASS